MKFVAILALCLSYFSVVFAESPFSSFFNTAPQGKPTINLALHENKIFSQNGEDGVIQAIFSLIGSTSKYYVDFGAGNGHRLSNTKYLRTQRGWRGLLLDVQYQDLSINLYKEMVTSTNINALFAKYRVPENFDLLSIDIDFNDFYVWQALDDKYKPRVVIIEYNGTHFPYEDKIVIQNPSYMWDGSNYQGASMLALYNLGRSKGYSLVFADSQGVNLFFIRDEIVERIPYAFINMNSVPRLYRKPRYGKGPNGGHRADPHNRPYVSSDRFIIPKKPPAPSKKSENK